LQKISKLTQSLPIYSKCSAMRVSDRTPLAGSANPSDTLYICQGNRTISSFRNQPAKLDTADHHQRQSFCCSEKSKGRHLKPLDQNHQDL